MITDEKKEFLELLVLKAGVAGDHYYFKMEEDVFNAAMKGDEEEDFYKEYAKQREIGLGNYANEVKAEITKISSSEELHYLVTDYNYDDGAFLLEQVALHPMCDIATAKMIYWLSEPASFYEDYGSLENCSKKDLYYDFAKFLSKMEEKAKTKGYQSGLIVDLPEDVMDIQDEVDFSISPYNKIPECFRS